MSCMSNYQKNDSSSRISFFSSANSYKAFRQLKKVIFSKIMMSSTQTYMVVHTFNNVFPQIFGVKSRKMTKNVENRLSTAYIHYFTDTSFHKKTVFLLLFRIIFYQHASNYNIQVEMFGYYNAMRIVFTVFHFPRKTCILRYLQRTPRQ